MKTIPSILLFLVLAACSSCTTPAPTPPSPPPPAPMPVGSYVVREYDVNGNVIHTYSGVTSFRETRFPRTVFFEYDGRTIVLDGSYQISRSLK